MTLIKVLLSATIQLLSIKKLRRNMSLAEIPLGKNAPEEINVVIEIPKGSRNKYEYDEDMDAIKLDRVAFTAMAHPYDYGFIPETRSEDGDHLDSFVLLDTSVFPGCVVNARPIGLLKMVDDGDNDEKIISVPVDDIRYDNIKSLKDLSPHIQKEIQHFFEHYKDLQNKKVEITGWGDREEAHQIIRESIERFSKE
jgi:inorganic pyrophosphatase